MNQELISAIAEAFESAEYSGRVYQVGGAVRDELLGLSAGHDIDLVLEGDADAAARHLFDCGLAEGTPQIFENFGTAMVMIQGVAVEIVSARRESYRGDSRKPTVEPATLLEDAQRRDFTVNTLLRRLSDGEMVDPLGRGLTDLKTMVLATPLDPIQTFTDDPLRILRAIRFRAQLGFSYAEGLEDAITSTANRLEIISAERIQGELVRMLALPAASHAMADLVRLGVSKTFWPELDQMVGVTQGKYHDKDVWEHTLAVVANAGPDDLVVALAALLHDVGKPKTRSVDEAGQIRFFTHEVVGAEMAQSMLDRLRFGSGISDQVSRLVRNHMRLGSAPTLTPAAARRLIRDMGDDLQRLLAVIEADSNGLKAGVKAIDLERIRESLAKAQAVTPRSTLVSPLSGDELMEIFDRPQGIWIKEVKAHLEDQVVEGNLAPGDKLGATKLARDFFTGESKSS